MSYQTNKRESYQREIDKIEPSQGGLKHYLLQIHIVLTYEYHIFTIG